MSGRPYLLGLTGSIGTGKSTVAKLFADEGIPVWDADAVVHRLYAHGGAAVGMIGKLAPLAVKNGAVDRAKLRDAIIADAGLLPRIESAIHPLVLRDRIDFIEEIAKSGHEMAIFDVPLLFESAGEKAFDRVVVVTCPPEMQRQRVLARPGMNPQAFDLVLARQMPDLAKQARADFVIDTSGSIADTRAQVRNLIHRIRTEFFHA